MIQDGPAAIVHAAPRPAVPSWLRTWPGRGTVAACALIVLAMVVPAVFGWTVHAFSVPPLHARWRPRFGPGTLPAVLIGGAAIRWGPLLAARLSWPRLLLAAFAAGVGWLVSLAVVDGRAGLGAILATPDEYLRTADHVTSVSATLHEFISRIPATSAHAWPVHVAGHPPGALLVFVALDRLGISRPLSVGVLVTLLAATIPLAVLITVRRLASDRVARRVAPLLVIGPSAIWLAVSADAMFAAVGAWGLCCLALSATARGRRGRWGAAIAAGLLLGACTMLSYGLPLLAVLAFGVLLAARDTRAIPLCALGVAGVVLGFAWAGFAWWDAYPVVRTRYYAGIASVRPAAYWLWGDLAALTVSAGPVLGASVALAARRVRAVRHGPAVSRPVVILTLSAAACIVLADVSLMSKAETERIWLPFVPWLLLGAAVLPDRWRRHALAGQVVLAIAVQTLLLTTW